MDENICYSSEVVTSTDISFDSWLTARSQGEVKYALGGMSIRTKEKHPLIRRLFSIHL